MDGIPSNDVYTISVRDAITKLTETKGDVPIPRFGHASCLLGNMFFVWGGSTRVPGHTGEDTYLDNTLYALNIGTCSRCCQVQDGI